MRTIKFLNSIGVTFLLLLVVSCSKSDFERGHDKALRENPPDIEFVVRTLDGTKKLRVSETLRFEELYTAKYRNQWHIEVLEGWNSASISNVAFINDGKKTWTLNFLGRRFACCNSRNVWLDLNPTRLPYPGFLSFRQVRLPRKPAKYQMYVQTARVFDSSTSMKTYSGSGVSVASNILEFEVIDKDSKWESRKLGTVLAVLKSAPKDKPEWAIACSTLLSDLNGDEAVQEKLRRLKQGASCASSFGLVDADNPTLAYEGLMAILSETERQLDWSDAGILSALRLRLNDRSLYTEDFWPESFNPDNRYKALYESWQRETKAVKMELQEICNGKRQDLRTECKERFSY